MVKVNLLSLFLFTLIGFVSAQTDTSRLKYLSDKTVQDFSDNQLENLIINNNDEVSVEFSHPMQKIGEVFTSTIPSYRFVEFNNKGEYVDKRIYQGDILIQKKDSLGNILSGEIVVNDTAGSIEKAIVNTAILNDGTSIVIWKNSNRYNKGYYGQLINNQNIKIGDNFKIADLDWDWQRPIVKADNQDSCFYFLAPSNKITAFKIYTDGKFETIASSLTGNYGGAWEGFLYFKRDSKRNFIIAWTGATALSTNYHDIYIRKFDSDFNPLLQAVKVDDDPLIEQQIAPAFALDENDNIFAAWQDGRKYQSSKYDIFAQILAPDLEKIGKNVQINNGEENCTGAEVYYINGRFRISWLENSETYNCFYEYNPILNAEMVSNIFDAGIDGQTYNEIKWNESLPEGTDIQFQIRSSDMLNSIENKSWEGPSGKNFYSNSSGEQISTIHNNNRYIQYRALFFRSTPALEPKLHKVEISFTTPDSTAPAKPVLIAAEAGHSRVKLYWKQNREKDIKYYKVLRRSELETSYKDIGVVPNQDSIFVDSNVISTRKYFYYIIAVDYNYNLSSSSDTLSAVPFAVDVYVSKNGNSSGDGTISNPYSSIKEAMENALYMDSVKVLPGEYDEEIFMRKGISLIGVEGAVKTILLGGNRKKTLSASDSSVIKGFTFTRSSTETFTACANTTGSPLITENIFVNYGNEDFLSYAVKTLNGNPIISQNFIQGFAYGIISSLGKAQINNNVILTTSTAIQISDYAKTNIYNNTIINSRGTAIDILLYSTASIYNNILYSIDSTGSIGIKRNGTSIISKLDYNDVWNFSENYKSTTPGPHNITTDPLFRNLGLQDFHLTENSKCIDAGNPDSIYNDNDNSRNDMGAFGGQTPFPLFLTSKLVKSIGITSSSAFPGDTVVSSVYTNYSAGIKNVNFDLKFNENILSYAGFEKTSSTKNFQVSVDKIYPGTIRINMEGKIADANESSILNLKF